MTQNREENQPVIMAKLYPCNLRGCEGKFTAHISAEKPLNVADICVTAAERKDADVHHTILEKHVNLFLAEIARQLVKGRTVTNEYFSIQPKIKGLFDTERSPVDPVKHSADFTFQKQKGFRSALQKIEIRIDGAAAQGGAITRVEDVDSGEVNARLSPGGIVKITGVKLRISGDAERTGLYFVREEGGARVRFNGKFSKNDPSGLEFVVPQLEAGRWRIEIMTQYSSASTLLNEPRVVVSPFVNEVQVI
jgi:hypothetical protein